jgi:hypothetical protein
MKPEQFGIKVIAGKDVVIDTKKVKFQGNKFSSLGAFGRRKFENFLVMNLKKR